MTPYMKKQQQFYHVESLWTS